MKTLIIDNYDSFTFNLVQLVAVVNEEEPIVITNDFVGSLEDYSFDNIIISPGPGHPRNKRDVGICLDIVRHSNKPILGVCLGMQVIAFVDGSEVRHSPSPYHGRTSHIFHNRESLFVDLPSPFFATRYHSLAVYLSSESSFIKTAQTDSGVLMALQHSSRPIWGVQFHPESVATQNGVKLLTNYRNLSSKHSARSRVFMPEQTIHTTESCERITKILEFRRIPLEICSEQLFLRMYGKTSVAFWLDSSSVQENSRFSFMGSPVDVSGYVCSYHSMTKSLSVCGNDSKWGLNSEHSNQSIFEWLEKTLKKITVENPELPFSFCGGFVGYLGYELKGEISGRYKHQSDLPDACMMYVESFLAIDHFEQEIYLVALADSSDEACSVLDDMSHRLSACITKELDPEFIPSSEIFILHEKSKLEYLNAVESAMSYIRDGESYQVCLTNQLYCDCKVDPLALYMVLRKHNPAPFAAFLRYQDFSILSSSPERFLKLDDNRDIEAKPIKGSAARSSYAEKDTELAKNLQVSEKNRAENLMIVDLLRNDLGRVSVSGSVTVPNFLEIESFSTVHQLVSTVRSKLKDELSPIDCIKAAFPGGSMTGAPKIRTMEIIDELESCARGIYSGALGYISLSGCFDLSIVIRTIIAHGGRLSIGAGGGIVALSDAEEEYEEMLLKTKALVEAIEIYCKNRGME